MRLLGGCWESVGRPLGGWETVGVLLVCEAAETIRELIGSWEAAGVFLGGSFWEVLLLVGGSPGRLSCEVILGGSWEICLRVCLEKQPVPTP